MDALPKCDDVEKENDCLMEPLDVVVLKQCGELFFDLFKQYKNNSSPSFSNSHSSPCSEFHKVGETYIDIVMEKTFKQLYDMMSHDLEKLDSFYQTRPIQLYDDLNDFMQCIHLHKINRCIFGEGPSLLDWKLSIGSVWQTVWTWVERFTDKINRNCSGEEPGPPDSKPNNECVWKTVRTWFEQFSDETKVPESLISTYKMTALSQKLNSHDISRVAFAVFCFLQGYDTSVDIGILYIFHDIEKLCKPMSFQQVYNSVLRNVRMFLDSVNASEKNKEFFETLVIKPNIIAMFCQMFDLLTKQPEIADKFKSNPFFFELEDIRKSCDVIGRKILPSYIIQLRIFYRQILKELFTFFSYQISPVDVQCLCCIKKVPKSQLFEDVYNSALCHFKKIFNEYNWPETMLETFHDMWQNEMFKEIIELFVITQVNFNSNLRHRRISKESNEFRERLCGLQSVSV